MFNATRVVAAVAIVALGGSLALIAGPLEPAEEPLAPSASLGPEDVVYVTGEATYLGDTEACEITFEDDYTDEQDCGVEYEFAMDDPRLSGLTSAVIDRRDPMGLTDTATIAGTTEVENEGGAWVGSYQGVALPGIAPMRMFWVGTGSGGYEGLSAVLFFDSTNVGSVFALEGMILPTEMLVYPE